MKTTYFTLHLFLSNFLCKNRPSRLYFTWISKNEFECFDFSIATLFPVLYCTILLQYLHSVTVVRIKWTHQYRLWRRRGSFFHRQWIISSETVPARTASRRESHTGLWPCWSELGNRENVETVLCIIIINLQKKTHTFDRSDTLFRLFGHNIILRFEPWPFDYRTGPSTHELHQLTLTQSMVSTSICILILSSTRKQGPDTFTGTPPNMSIQGGWTFSLPAILTCHSRVDFIEKRNHLTLEWR